MTTNTLDDARSIDINAGGRAFHINRDGSRITSAEPSENLPAYDRTSFDGSIQQDDILYSGDIDRSTIAPSIAETQHEDDDHVQSQVFSTPIAERSPARHWPEQDLSTAMSGIPAEEATPSREPSYKAGQESITVPRKDINRRSQSDTAITDPTTSSSSMNRLRRRNGIRLPTLQTSQLPHIQTPSGLSPSPNSASASASASPFSRSAGATFPRNALTSTRFLTPDSSTSTSQASVVRKPLNFHSMTSVSHLERSSTLSSSSQTASQAHPSTFLSNVPLDHDTDHENEISTHYIGMIRFIDRSHRSEIHTLETSHRSALEAKDKELSEMRLRLNEVDTVYRQQLRARDFQIDDLRKRLANLEVSVEARLERARNQVEDIWEARWRERDALLRDKMRTTQLEATETLKRLKGEHEVQMMKMMQVAEDEKSSLREEHRKEVGRRVGVAVQETDDRWYAMAMDQVEKQSIDGEGRDGRTGHQMALSEYLANAHRLERQLQGAKPKNEMQERDHSLAVRAESHDSGSARARHSAEHLGHDQVSQAVAAVQTTKDQSKRESSSTSEIAHDLALGDHQDTYLARKYYRRWYKRIAPSMKVP